MVAEYFRNLIVILLYVEGEAAVVFRRKSSSGGVFLEKRLLPTSNFSSKAYLTLSSPYQVNILMIADYSLYRKFLQLSDGDVESSRSATDRYLKTIFEQVRLIFDANPVKDSDCISLNFAGATVIHKQLDCPFAKLCTVSDKKNFRNTTICKAHVDAVFAVDLIHKWILKKSSLIPIHDHAIILTTYDLLSLAGDSGTQGMAYVGTMCQNLGSASVVEDIGGMATAVIATHELTHSLGAFHDGIETGNECDAKTNHLMSPLVTGSDNEAKLFNSFKLSSCSIEQIRKFLRKKSSRCLRKGGIRLRRRKLFETQNEQWELPGETYRHDEQCRIAFGVEYRFCNHDEYYEGKNRCARLWCKNKYWNETNSCETKSYLPLLDGTSCGEFKWCKAGKCVSSGERDRECTDLNSKMCAQAGSKLPRFCKVKSFKKLCCLTCYRILSISKL